MLYYFSSKPNNELFPCVHSTAYSHFPDSCPHNSLTLRTPTSSLQLVKYHLYNHVSSVSMQLSSRQNGKFRRYRVESSISSLVLSSVQLTIIITNTLINQAGSYYIITDPYLIQDRSQLYAVTRIISFYLHSTSALPQSRVITKISSM